MNKFLTIPLPLLLVAAFQGLAWGAMPENTPSETPAVPATQTLSGLPGTLEYSRFSSLGKKSPFTLASSTEEAADFAKDLVLAGFVRLDGEDFVMVANKTKPDRVLVGKKLSPSSQGMVLVEIKKDSSGDPTKMEARIKKGSEISPPLKYETKVASGPNPATNLPTQTAPSAPPIQTPGIPQPPGQFSYGQPGVQQGASNIPSLIRGRRTPVLPKSNK